MLFRLLLFSVLLLPAFAPQALAAPPARASLHSGTPDVPILLYHRFAPTVKDPMTITTHVFESHLKYLRDNGYKVIPLRQLVNYYLNGGLAPPPKSVVIVEDDAHVSVYTHMLPLVRKYNVPVTVFTYPSAISNASYAMTWDQLRTLKKTGLFDIESHTFWHPNFRKDRKRLKPAEFGKFVDTQMLKSKKRLEKELGGNVDLLAWPFGIYDDYLIKRAAAAGYKAAFTIEAHHAGAGDAPMKLPRYLMMNADQGKAFVRILEGTAPKRNTVF
jgi:peptidoglycan/xylan/chitin deacetylase (PgdA/CDA1 family)